MEPNERSSLLQQVERNAFRVLGLPADASQKAILERAAALDRAAKVGVIQQPASSDLEFFGQLRPDRTSISEALGRLSNPQQRLTERLFWITQLGRLLSDTSQGTLDSAILALQGSLFSTDQHDAAVFSLAACFLTDSDVQDAEGWGKALEMWADLISSDDFWSEFLDTEISGDFEPAASFEDVDQLRGRSQQLALGPLAELARDAASRSEFDRCRRALDIIRTAPFPPEIGSAAEESVLGAYEDDLIRTSKEVTKRCWEAIRQDRASAELNAKACSLTVDRWKQDLEPRYRNLVAMSGAVSDVGLRARQEYADFLTGLGNAFSWADKWVDAERALKQALSVLPAASPSRERLLERSLELGTAAAEQREKERARGTQTDIKGFERLCEEIRAEILRLNPATMYGAMDAGGVCEQAYQRYDKTVLPWLSIILAASSEASQITLRAKAAAARCLLDIAEGFRHCDNRARASDLMVMAAGLAREESARVTQTAPQDSRLYSDSARRANSKATTEQDLRDGVYGFVQLCDSMTVEYRQRFRRSSGLADLGRNLVALISAHDDYKQRASPWLAQIVKSCHGDIPERVGDAAARLLSCLADGFIWVHDLEKAEMLAREALPLIDDDQLEMAVKGQLAQIASERRKPTTTPAPTNHEVNPPGRSAASGNQTATFPPASVALPLFHKLGYREQILLAGAVLVAFLLIILPLTTRNELRSSAGEASSPGPRDGLASPEATPADRWAVASSKPLPVAATPALRAEPAPGPITYRELRAVPAPIPVFTAIPVETATATKPYIQRDPLSLSLPNGTNLILPPTAEGLGELHITNNSSQDAVVKLKTVVGNETLRFVYVRARSAWVIPKIPVGNYFLEFATGRDWDAGSQSFRQDRAFTKFDNAQVYTEDAVSGGTMYSVLSVTLQPVQNGNAKTNAISAEEFGK
jgi:hypothetical protein